MEMKVFLAIAISLMVVNCGVLFEQRNWVKWSEWFRIISYPLILSVFAYTYDWSLIFHILAFVYFLISSFWFYAIQKKYAHLQMA
jgi:succinate dehydrogenase/fumarate reductase cytochrome b subunit